MHSSLRILSVSFGNKHKMRIETIKFGTWLAKINVSRGANLIRLYNEKFDAEILRTPDYDNLDNPYLYGMPILFPVNRISGGKFLFEGREYRFPINEQNTGCALHGFLHESEFEVKNKTENEISCLFRATKERPYISFPHTFEIELHYSLGEDGIHQKTIVRNTSSENMPCFLGFHTTFNTPFLKTSNIDDIVVHADLFEEYERNMQNYLITGKTLRGDRITEELKKGIFCPDKYLSRHYKAGCSGVMEIYDRRAGLKLVYENDRNFPFRLIYSQGSGYICLEPQNVMVDAANNTFGREKSGFFYIEPHREKIFVSRIILCKTL